MPNLDRPEITHLPALINSWRLCIMYIGGHVSITKILADTKHSGSLRWSNDDWTFDICIIETMVLAHVISYPSSLHLDIPL